MGRRGDFYVLEYVNSAPKSVSRRRFSPQLENHMTPVVFELTQRWGVHTGRRNETQRTLQTPPTETLKSPPNDQRLKTLNMFFDSQNSFFDKKMFFGSKNVISEARAKISEVTMLFTTMKIV